VDLVDRFSRTRVLFGEGFEKIQRSKVVIFGVGGVGSFVLDSLYRTGVGEITIIDCDEFDVTNQNRQIGSEALGEKKVEALARRYEGVTPIVANVDEAFLEGFSLEEFDVVVDAIDDIPAKVALAKRAHTKLLSSTGSAKKLNPLHIKVDSIWKSYGDKFARKFREALKKEGFEDDFLVVFSPEPPQCKGLGSFSAVTGSFGLQLASEAIRKILVKE